MLVRGSINAEVTLRGPQKERLAERTTTLTVARLVESQFGVMAELGFNVDHGYLEGLVRGMKAGILTRTDYHNLAQCDTLEGENIVSHWHFWNVFYLQLHPVPQGLLQFIAERDYFISLHLEHSFP